MCVACQAHDAATVYSQLGGPVGTQTGDGIESLLTCGARAFDIRAMWDGLTVWTAHGPLEILTKVRVILQEARALLVSSDGSRHAFCAPHCLLIAHRGLSTWGWQPCWQAKEWAGNASDTNDYFILVVISKCQKWARESDSPTCWDKVNGILSDEHIPLFADFHNTGAKGSCLDLASFRISKLRAFGKVIVTFGHCVNDMFGDYESSSCFMGGWVLGPVNLQHREQQRDMLLRLQLLQSGCPLDANAARHLGIQGQP